MKSGSKILFPVITLLIVVFAITAYFGVYSHYGDTTSNVIKGAGEVNWGIEGAGGIEYTLGPVLTDESAEDYNDAVIVGESETVAEESADETSSAAAEKLSKGLKDNLQILEKRLTFLGLKDAYIYYNANDRTYVIRHANDESQIDYLSTMQSVLLERGVFEGFVGDGTADEEGNPAVPFLTNEHISNTTLRQDTSGATVAQLSLTKEGKAILEQISTELAGTEETLSFMMDGTAVLQTAVAEAITSGVINISSTSSSSEAVSFMAVKLLTGVLSHSMVEESALNIPATITKETISQWETLTLVIGLLAILIMVVFFRLPGFVGGLIILLQAAILMASASGYMPDIAGIIVTKPMILGGVLSIVFTYFALTTIMQNIKSEIKDGSGEIKARYKLGFKKGRKATLIAGLSLLLIALVAAGVTSREGKLLYTLMRPFTFWHSGVSIPSINQFFGMFAIGALTMICLLNILFPILMYSIKGFIPEEKQFGGVK